jgi:hypothetical protein
VYSCGTPVIIIIIIIMRDEIRIAKIISNDIKMEFGIEKCANISVKKERSKETNM